MRASAVVNCQSTWRWSVLVWCCQAASSVLRMSRSLDAAVEALPGQDGQLDLGDVEPGAVFGGVVDLQALGQGERLGGFERLVERADAVGVEVVHDQHHGLGVGVVDGEQPLDLVGPVDLGASGLGVDVAPAAQRLDPDEDRAGAVADVLVVLAAVPARRGGDRVAGVVEELVGLLVHADHRPGRIVGSGVDGQHVFHPGDELRVGRAAGWSSTSSDEDEVSFF